VFLFTCRCSSSLRSPSFPIEYSRCLVSYIRRWTDANEEYVWEQEPERTFRRDGVWEQGEPERTGFVILSPLFCAFCVPLVVAGEAFLPKLFRVSQNPPCPATSSSGLLTSSVCVVFVANSRSGVRCVASSFSRILLRFLLALPTSQRTENEVENRDEAGAGDISML